MFDVEAGEAVVASPLPENWAGLFREKGVDGGAAVVVQRDRDVFQGLLAGEFDLKLPHQRN